MHSAQVLRNNLSGEFAKIPLALWAAMIHRLAVVHAARDERQGAAKMKKTSN